MKDSLDSKNPGVKPRLSFLFLCFAMSFLCFSYYLWNQKAELLKNGITVQGERLGTENLRKMYTLTKPAYDYEGVYRFRTVEGAEFITMSPVLAGGRAGKVAIVYNKANPREIIDAGSFLAVWSSCIISGVISAVFLIASLWFRFTRK